MAGDPTIPSGAQGEIILKCAERVRPLVRVRRIEIGGFWVAKSLYVQWQLVEAAGIETASGSLRGSTKVRYLVSAPGRS